MIAKDKGSLGEAKAICWLIENGYKVFTPFDGTNEHFDLIAYKDSILFRVSVKATSYIRRKNYVVTLKNQHYRSNRLEYKYFDNTACDLLLVYILPENRIVVIDPKTILSKLQVTILRAT